MEEAKRAKIEVKKAAVYINGKIQKKHIHPPTVSEMFNIDATTQAKLDKISLHQTVTLKEKSSEFTGLALRISSPTDICLAYKKAKQMFPKADHIMLAYQCKQNSGYHDNGEHSAGKRLANIMSDKKMLNTALFVARVYGRIPLGQRQFIYIEKAVRDALDMVQAAF